MQTVTNTASIGSVVIGGPPGINRAADVDVSYTPSGYNHIYGALAFAAAGNKIDVNVSVGAGSLIKPLIIISNYTVSTLPASVKLNSVVLAQDVDYFPSVRTATSQLWITLNESLIGATNRIEVAASVGGPAVPGAPPNVTVTRGNGRAVLHYDAAFDGGSVVLDYTATCGGPGGPTAVSNTLSVTVGGLTNGLLYSCSVKARNGIGYSPDSAAVNVIPTADFGRGDIDNDGKADLLWRNVASGVDAIWTMNGTTVINAYSLPTIADGNWDLVGVGDYNGDGQNDIYWRHRATGANAVWQMNGTNVVSGIGLPGTAPPWEIKAVADFLGNAYPDILWRNATTGANAIWQMSGTTVAAVVALPGVTDLAWKIVGTGDFNGDGRTDIVWRNDGGSMAVWIMNNGAVQSTATLPGLPDPWVVGAIADMDGDGKVDIVLRNSSTGANAVWKMNGTAFVSGLALRTAADTNFKMVGPR